jgi:hypothetical protein
MLQQIPPRVKTQTLSLRLDPKTRFVLEFLAKINRQSITTVVEEAIRQSGAAGTVGIRDSFGDERKTWRDYWDVSEGVRTLRMLADENIPSSYDDDELRDFLEQHLEFFSEAKTLADPDRLNIHVLWPKIDEYLVRWRETKRSDPFQVGREMVTALKEAGVQPPQWPRAPKPKPMVGTSSPSSRSLAEDLDDDIPF